MVWLEIIIYYCRLSVLDYDQRRQTHTRKNELRRGSESFETVERGMKVWPKTNSAQDVHNNNDKEKKYLLITHISFVPRFARV